MNINRTCVVVVVVVALCDAPSIEILLYMSTQIFRFFGAGGGGVPCNAPSIEFLLYTHIFRFSVIFSVQTNVSKLLCVLSTYITNTVEIPRDLLKNTRLSLSTIV